MAAPAPDLADAALALGLALSPEALERLHAFEALLRERAIPLGLVAAADAPRIRARHLVDSLRAAAAVITTDRVAFDLGSGAGLPGVVVAIALPRLRVGLVEPRRARVAFLELVVEQLALTNAEIRPHRIEEVGDRADVCFARALAPPAEAWRLASLVLRPGGRLVYFAGAERWSADEVAGPVSIELREDAVLESGGPLAIMTR